MFHSFIFPASNRFLCERRTNRSMVMFTSELTTFVLSCLCESDCVSSLACFSTNYRLFGVRNGLFNVALRHRCNDEKLFDFICEEILIHYQPSRLVLSVPMTCWLPFMGSLRAGQMPFLGMPKPSEQFDGETTQCHPTSRLTRINCWPQW